MLFATRVVPAAAGVVQRLMREGQQQWQQLAEQQQEREGRRGQGGEGQGGVALEDFSSGRSGKRSVTAAGFKED